MHWKRKTGVREAREEAAMKVQERMFIYSPTDYILSINVTVEKPGEHCLNQVSKVNISKDGTN